MDTEARASDLADHQLQHGRAATSPVNVVIELLRNVHDLRS